MNKEFGRIITNLRKRKGLTQKDAAAELGISQALLSHYEKGIRECGLEFLIKTADLYEVSVDYLLGRTGGEEIPEVDEVDAGRAKGNTYCMLNRRLLTNTTSIIFSLLAQINNKRLTRGITEYLSVAQFEAFRNIFFLGDNDPEGVFELEGTQVDAYAQALLPLLNARVGDIRDNRLIEGEKLSADILTDEYGDAFSSLHMLIKNAEKALSANFKI